MQKSVYRPEIDGLRAIAVTAVVLFHLGLGHSGGFVGVDVFFVISGFLITGIICRELDQSQFSLSQFWERRVRRILPALSCMLAGTLLIGYVLLLPQELEELGASCAAQGLLLANFHFWHDTGYFAAPAELKPLLHTWSLAVEEQFYLMLPLVLMLFRSASRQWRFWSLVAIALVSFGGSVLAVAHTPNAAFFLLPARAWELLVGSALGALPAIQKSHPRTDGLLAASGLLLIVVPIYAYGPTTPFPGLAAIPPVIGTAAVIYATSATRDTAVGSVLSYRPVVFLGLISYSLYLWHWPVIVFVRSYFGHLGWKQCVLAMAGSVTLAVASWRFIERPFRNPERMPCRRRLLAAAVISSAVTVMLGLLLVTTQGLPARFPHYSPALLEDTVWTGEEFENPLQQEFKFDRLPRLGINLQPGQAEGRLDFVLWGDSHGRTLCDTLDAIAEELSLSGRAVVTSNVISIPNVYMPFNDLISPVEMMTRQDAVMSMLAEKRPRNLILASRWSWYTDGPSEVEAEANARRHILSDRESGPAALDRSEDVLCRNLKQLAVFCERKGITLWVVKQVPETGELLPARELLLFTVGRKDRPSNTRASVEDHRRRQHKVEEVFAHEAFANVRFLDPSPYFFDSNGLVVNYRQGRSVYRDNDHLTKWGLESLRDLIRDALLEMKAQASLDRSG